MPACHTHGQQQVNNGCTQHNTQASHNAGLPHARSTAGQQRLHTAQHTGVTQRRPATRTQHNSQASHNAGLPHAQHNTQASRTDAFLTYVTKSYRYRAFNLRLLKDLYRARYVTLGHHLQFLRCEPDAASQTHPQSHHTHCKCLSGRVLTFPSTFLQRNHANSPSMPSGRHFVTVPHIFRPQNLFD